MQRSICATVLALALALGLCSCGGGGGGESSCEKQCNSSRDKLINNFGIKPEAVNCADPKWDAADTCQKCIALFAAEFQVQITIDCNTY